MRGTIQIATLQCIGQALGGAGQRVFLKTLGVGRVIELTQRIAQGLVGEFSFSCCLLHRLGGFGGRGAGFAHGFLRVALATRELLLDLSQTLELAAQAFIWSVGQRFRRFGVLLLDRPSEVLDALSRLGHPLGARGRGGGLLCRWTVPPLGYIERTDACQGDQQGPDHPKPPKLDGRDLGRVDAAGRDLAAGDREFGEPGIFMVALPGQQQGADKGVLEPGMLVGGRSGGFEG